MNNFKPIVIVVAAVVILAVVAVFVVPRQEAAPDSAAEAITSEDLEVSVVEEPTPTTAVQATEAPSEAEEAATEVMVPTERAGLEATDPATVKLASGQLQLIEAFAFW